MAKCEGNDSYTEQQTLEASGKKGNQRKKQAHLQSSDDGVGGGDRRNYVPRGTLRFVQALNRNLTKQKTKTIPEQHKEETHPLIRTCRERRSVKGIRRTRKDEVAVWCCGADGAVVLWRYWGDPEHNFGTQHEPRSTPNSYDLPYDSPSTMFWLRMRLLPWNKKMKINLPENSAKNNSRYYHSAQ